MEIAVHDKIRNKREMNPKRAGHANLFHISPTYPIGDFSPQYELNSTELCELEL